MIITNATSPTTTEIIINTFITLAVILFISCSETNEKNYCESNKSIYYDFGSCGTCCISYYHTEILL